MMIDHTDPFAPPPNPMEHRSGWSSELIAPRHAGQAHGRQIQRSGKARKAQPLLVLPLLGLAYLAPDITAAILDGHQPAGLSTRALIEWADLPNS
jgi:hypothetical protein